ncbi:MAG: hypothetical protein V2A73_22045 [Pseudomonadota bacterium]
MPSDAWWRQVRALSRYERPAGKSVALRTLPSGEQSNSVPRTAPRQEHGILR